jgi:hypothetical protein
MRKCAGARAFDDLGVVAHAVGYFGQALKLLAKVIKLRVRLPHVLPHTCDPSLVTGPRIGCGGEIPLRVSSQPGKSENEAPAPTHGSTTWSRGELAAVPVRMIIAGAFDACLLSGALQKQPIGLQGVGSKCGEAWRPVNRLLLEKPNMLRRPGRRRHCEVCGHRGDFRGILDLAESSY